MVELLEIVGKIDRDTNSVEKWEQKDGDLTWDRARADEKEK